MSDDKKKISLPIAGDESVDSQGAPKTRAEGGDILSEIEKMVTDNNVVLFMKGTPQQPMCGFSARAAAIVASHDRPFFAVNVLADEEVREGVKAYGDWPTIPQLYIGGELVGGSDIMSKMQEADDLGEMIEATFGDAE